jgi:hypothetical protein
MYDFVAFGSPAYWWFLGLLTLGRGADFLSTYIATPNLVLEANPVARKLGWRGGIAVNVIVCALCAAWPLPAIVIATTSVLVAARNFQSAWLMRAAGEHAYRSWITHHLAQAGLGLYLGCLAGQTLLTAGLGAALILASDLERVTFAIGVGLITYAIAVVVFTLPIAWRARRQQG